MTSLLRRSIIAGAGATALGEAFARGRQPREPSDRGIGHRRGPDDHLRVRCRPETLVVGPGEAARPGRAWLAVLRPTIRSAAQEAAREPVAEAKQAAEEAKEQAQQANEQAQAASGTAAQANRRPGARPRRAPPTSSPSAGG